MNLRLGSREKDPGTIPGDIAGGPNYAPGDTSGQVTPQGREKDPGTILGDIAGGPNYAPGDTSGQPTPGDTSAQVTPQGRKGPSREKDPGTIPGDVMIAAAAAAAEGGVAYALGPRSRFIRGGTCFFL